MPLLLLFLSTLTATAGVQRCVECCRDAGLAGCPTRLRIFGPGSAVSREGGAWRVSGVWWLDCEQGASFESGGTVVLDHSPIEGEILRLASPPQTVRCYSQTCGTPPGACISESGGVFAIRRCADSQPLDALALSQPVRAPGVRPAVVAHTPLPEPTGSITVDLQLPEAPAQDCQTAPALAEASRDRVRLGDSARTRSDLDGAVQEYLAAIALDRCSAQAWAALGQVALQGARPVEAIRALQIATRLHPEHYPAFTALGQALERMGQLDRASVAYARALSIHPEHAPASAGLLRVQDDLNR